MKFIDEYINVDRHLETKQQPVFLMDFTPGKEYHTAVSSLASDDIEWSISRSGDKVRIPIFAYRTSKELGTSVWSAGLHCGLRAIHSWGIERWGDDPESVVLVFGDTCHEVEDGYRVYLGLTMVKDKYG